VNNHQREIVTLYALLNRIFWMSEIGIQFNQNTSTTVDARHVRDAARAIDGLITELG
jgi:hypothetical protein